MELVQKHQDIYAWFDSGNVFIERSFMKLKILSLQLFTLRTLLENVEVVPLNEQIVAAYIQEIEPTRIFSTLKVCFDGTDYWLFDGYHRLEAMKRLGFNTCTVQIFKGSRRDAFRRYIKDKLKCEHRESQNVFKHCLRILSEDEEWSNLDASKLATLFDRKQVFFNNLQHWKSYGWLYFSISINKHGTFNLLRR